MRRRGPGGRRASEPPITSTEELNAWFAGSLPDDWFTEPVETPSDRDEIIVTGTLTAPTVADDAPAEVAEEARIAAFREQSRTQRVAVAGRAQSQFERHITWAVRCGA